MVYDKDIINRHNQKHMASCIPSCVEMILKLLGKVHIDYYDLQDEWNNKADGSFANFDKKTIYDVTFHREFNQQRGVNSPIDELFERIDRELQDGRFVCVSLCSNDGWHMYVIHKRTNGDYAAFSKGGQNGQETIEVTDVRQKVTNMRGTDILTYSLSAE
ncbi:MAG: hypothetical protein KAX39_06780 [candidate division Zixibacteria bacterium]|nr:hypothetical protein [candidate division Zixibacteria bacterium]